MRTMIWMFVTVSALWAQSASAQTTLPLVPVPVEGSTRSALPLYHANSGVAGNPCVCPPIATEAGSPVGGAVIQHPRYTVYRPLLPIVTMPPNYYVGPGVLGQLKVYVPGQPVRNFFRYLSP